MIDDKVKSLLIAMLVVLSTFVLNLWISLQWMWVKLIQDISYIFFERIYPLELIDKATDQSYHLAVDGIVPFDLVLKGNELNHLLDVNWYLKSVDLVVILFLSIWFEIIVLQNKNIIKLNFGKIVRLVKFFLIFTFFSLLLSLASFPVFFTYFHKVFFPHGNWMFTYDSLLIQSFPPVFWGLMWGGFVTFTGLEVVFVWVLEKRNKKKVV